MIEIVDGCIEIDIIFKFFWVECKKVYIVCFVNVLFLVCLVFLVDKLYNVRFILKDYWI